MRKPQLSSGVRAGALLAFVLADGVVAHPRPSNALDSVRLVGATDVILDSDAYARGKQQLASDDVAGALAAFRQALIADPKSSDAMNGMGVAYDRLGRADLARSCYQAGLAIDPSSPALLNNLGYSFFLSGDFAAAIGPLRAAAASSDSSAAITAAATLARLVADARVSPNGTTANQSDVARIEVTSDGEQRLSFAPPAPSSDVVAALGDNAADVVVATVWSDADDAALTAQVRDEVHDEELAQAMASRLAEPLPAEPIESAEAPLPSPSVVASSRSDSRAQRVPTARAVPAVVLAAAADVSLQRRVRPAVMTSAAALTDGPQPRAPLAFESDDAELNAFAARVRSGAAAKVTPLSGDRGRIAARFRT